MSCKINKNSKNGKINGVLNQTGQKSTLFQQLFNIPTLSLDEAINTYKNIYSDKLKDTVKFQIIGEKGAKNLDQIEEATFRMDNLLVAKQMEEAGKTAKEIRLSTGWEKNLADGKWRYEILDGTFLPIDLNFNVRQKLTIENPLAPTTLQEIYTNDELYKAYPQLKNTKVYVFESKNPMYDNNKMFVYNNEIFLNRRDYANNTERLTISDREGTSLIHEIQHLLAGIEGFSTGTSSMQEEKRIAKTIDYLRTPNNKSVERTEDQRRYDEFIENFIVNLEGRESFNNAIESGVDSDLIGKLYGWIIYQKFAGEVESRNVEKRFFMSPQERLNTLLSETQEIPFEDQFVLGFKNNMQSSEKTAPQITQEIIYKLKQTGLSEDVQLLSTEEINKRLEEIGEENVKNITNGLTYKDKKGKDVVVLNKDTATDETAVHEFGHIFSKWAKENRPDIWKKGQDLAKDAIKSGEIKEIENYVKQTQPNLKEGSEAFYDEVLQEFIGRESKNMMDEQKQKSPLMQWLSDFWDSIADLFNIFELSSSEIANLTLKDFADYSISALINNDIMIEKLVELNIIERIC